MVECRYYGACRYASGNCSNGGDDAPDCEDFVQMPDVDALLALADEIEDRAAPDMGLNGDTTPAWYAAARMKNVARRIREACGEASR